MLLNKTSSQIIFRKILKWQRIFNMKYMKYMKSDF